MGALAWLKPRGYMMSFGQSSGTSDSVLLPALAAKSLFLTSPSLEQCTTTQDELLECAAELFACIASGVLKVFVNHTYPLRKQPRRMQTLKVGKRLGQWCWYHEAGQEVLNHSTETVACHGKYVKNWLGRQFSM